MAHLGESGVVLEDTDSDSRFVYLDHYRPILLPEIDRMSPVESSDEIGQGCDHLHAFQLVGQARTRHNAIFELSLVGGEEALLDDRFGSCAEGRERGGGARRYRYQTTQVSVKTQLT